MNPFRLVRAQGPQEKNQWVLPPDRPTRVGRYDPDQVAPEIDLWPDSRVSRRHARLWFEHGAWWIEDQESKHGTLVGGHEIKGQGPTRLEPWVEIQMGDTVLMLAPPHWHRLRSRDLVVEVEVTPAVNVSLVHCGVPIVSRLMVRNWGAQQSAPGTLKISIPGCAQAEPIAIPALQPGQSLDVPRPRFRFDHQALENQTERSRCLVSVRLDGHTLQGDLIECWVLAHNEWSCADEHWLSVAAFVLPTHPLVEQVALEASQRIGGEGKPEEVLKAVYESLFADWHLGYLCEPPSYESNSQKVRFPHQVLLDFVHRRGQGTCIDLALLIAACLEYLKLQPLIAILDMGECRHVLVGCWQKARGSLEPLIIDRQRVLKGALWVEPNGCTRDPDWRKGFSPSREAAVRYLTEKPLVFALDIAAARDDGIIPLPFAGEPQWSEAAKKAIQAAQAYAEAARTRLATVPLLLGLLSLAGGLTRQVVAARLGNIEQVVQRLSKALPKRAGSPPPSQHYGDALDLARSRAKVEGSPLVLEVHLLPALLEIQSEALDKALRGLGTHRKELLETLQEIRLRTHPDHPPYSVFSEFPSQF